MKPLRVLVVGWTATTGGIEHFLMAYCGKMNRERVQFEARVALEARLREQETATREAQAAVEELQASLAALRDEHERAMNAAEQKIGRAVCRIPRAVQRKLLSMKRREQ